MITFKNKAFDFICLPKVLRSTNACNNLPPDFKDIGIPMTIHNLNSCIRSTLFNYKEFVPQLDIDKFLKCKNPSKCCWFSVRLRTKWFWVSVQLQSLKLQISQLLRARSSWTFRQL